MFFFLFLSSRRSIIFFLIFRPRLSFFLCGIESSSLEDVCGRALHHLTPRTTRGAQTSVMICERSMSTGWNGRMYRERKFCSRTEVTVNFSRKVSVVCIARSYTTCVQLYLVQFFSFGGIQRHSFLNARTRLSLIQF